MSALPPYSLLPDRVFTSLADWPDAGKALARAREHGPEWTIAQVKAAGLRGRGGAGFPTAIKWGNIRADQCAVKYMVCNSAEGEPGTYKDRNLLRRNPYIILEGLAIGAYALGAKEAWVCMKVSFEYEYQHLSAALTEMQAAGLLGDIPIHIARGADEYLLGEERGLLEAIEGNFPFPRVSPPYIHGLFTAQGMFSAETDGNNPACVNNQETLCHVFNIILHGPEYFRSVGSEQTPGTGMFTLLGDVENPGIFELPIGTSFKVLLEQHGRGIKGGRRFKFMMSGVSSGVMIEKDLDTPMDFHTMRAIDSSLGSGGYIVFGEDTSALDVAYAYSRFLANESCGQCQSCKTGTGRITEHLENLAYGVGTQEDLEAIETDLGLVATGNRCFLPVAEKALIRSLFSNFPEDFFAGLKPRVPAEIPVAKIKGFDAEKKEFLFDPRYPWKRPDGGYNTQAQGKYFYSTRASREARRLTRV